MSGFFYVLTSKYTWIFLTASMMALWVHWAIGGELTCQQYSWSKYEHCWNNHGETTLTIEHNDNGIMRAWGKDAPQSRSGLPLTLNHN